MKQEDKELLLRDLCGRLPYGVVVAEFDEDGQRISIELPMVCIENDFSFYGNVRPYLFPLSSMTEEQNKELHDKLIDLELKALNDEISRIEAVSFEIDYYLKNHFDYRGLIEKGLAIDATGLNIYKEEVK